MIAKLQKLTPLKKERIHSLDDFDLEIERVKLGKTPAKMYTWKDEKGHKVAEFKVWKWWDGINVSDLEISRRYRGYKLSYQLLDYATKKLGVVNLAVKKKNKIAKHVYDKYGFKVTEEGKDIYYMSLK